MKLIIPVVKVTNHLSRHLTILLINWALVIAFIALLWWPLWVRYSYRNPSVPKDIVEPSRYLPANEVFDKLNEVSFSWPLPEHEELISRANEISRGRYSLQSDDNSTAGLPSVEMKMASLWTDDPFHNGIWPAQLQAWLPMRILLTAYAVDPNPKYLHTARDLILSWLDWINKAPLRGQLGNELTWNDSAVSTRTVVLAQFWRYYRRSESFNLTVGLRLLEAVALHAHFLLDPRHYNFQSNLGMMQNIALLHLSATFPLVIEKSYTDVAIERIDEQIRLLVSPEGVMTEHSPLYHVHAMTNLRSAAFYLPILDRDIPAAWHEVYTRMVHVLNQFARPDGTLPAIGDTSDIRRSPGQCRVFRLGKYPLGDAFPASACGSLDNWQPQYTATSIWPYAGYAVLWDHAQDDPKQLVMTWSHFPGHGHKHADELSLYLYASGKTWLTGTGYWPYSSPERTYATGWAGSNAPYYEDETKSRPRIERLTNLVADLLGLTSNDGPTARLVSYANSPQGNFLHVERMGANGFLAQRQVLWHRPNQWIIFDTVTAPHGQQVVIPWHFSPELEASGNHAGTFWRFGDDTQTNVMQVRIAGSNGVSTQLFKGSKDPFQGWTYKDGFFPAPTIEIRHPGPELWLTTWLSMISPSEDLSNSHLGTMQVNFIGDPNQWSMTLPCSVGKISVERTPEAIHIIDANCTSKSSEYRLMISPINDVSKYQRSYQSLKKTLESKYHTYEQTSERLTKLTVAVLTVWVAQELFFLLLVWKRQFQMIILLRLMSCVALFISFCLWYGVVYS